MCVRECVWSALIPTKKSFCALSCRCLRAGLESTNKFVVRNGEYDFIGHGWVLWGEEKHVSAMIYIPCSRRVPPCSIFWISNPAIHVVHRPTPGTSTGFLVNKSEGVRADLQADPFHRIQWGSGICKGFARIPKLWMLQCTNSCAVAHMHTRRTVKNLRLWKPTILTAIDHPSTLLSSLRIKWRYPFITRRVTPVLYSNANRPAVVGRS